MKKIAVQIGATAGACAVIAGTASGVLATHHGPDSGLTARTEPTEITQVAPSEPQVPSASPSVTGPAPLPSEEQGVPG